VAKARRWRRTPRAAPRDGARPRRRRGGWPRRGRARRAARAGIRDDGGSAGDDEAEGGGGDAAAPDRGALEDLEQHVHRRVPPHGLGVEADLEARGQPARRAAGAFGRGAPKTASQRDRQNEY
jgi:hypothetical protein